jgi:hypothetical protein
MPDVLPDIRSIPPDLCPPPVVEGAPGPGRRVCQVAPEYQGTQVHHTLYLPTDWQEGRRYPVIVEYAGNGPYENEFGDLCTGRVEDSVLGYGASGGQGFLWLCLPFISEDHRHNQLQWWGDVEATVDYCLGAVRRVCEEYGGDPRALILAGFSRGAIACGFIGLHDERVSALWRAFIVHSHYDGVRLWDYAGCDRASALERLKRLRGRPQFISHEGSVRATEDYLRETGIEGSFTFQELPFRNHTDTWVLRDLAERARLRQWLQAILRGPFEK